MIEIIKKIEEEENKNLENIQLKELKFRFCYKNYINE